MEIYVDKMPESCIDCPCHNGEHGHCQINNKSVFIYRPADCPLKSLVEHNAEKDKEIKRLKRIVDGIDKLKQYTPEIEKYVLLNPDSSYCNGYTLTELLNQITEKDTEIETLKTSLYQANMQLYAMSNLKHQLQTQRNELIEEIKQVISDIDKYGCVKGKDIFDCLNQLKGKGEK